MELRRRNAGAINEAHIGKHVRYGPHFMFEGKLERFVLIEGWLKHANGNRYRAVVRVQIWTDDRRSATLAVEETIELED